MLKRARELMKYGMRIRMEGPYPKWITDIENVSVQEKVFILCLMNYYLNRDMSFHYACIEVFNRCREKICPEKIAHLEKEIEREDIKQIYPNRNMRICIVLGNYFEESVIELINGSDITEAGVESIAKYLYEEYFV